MDMRQLILDALDPQGGSVAQKGSNPKDFVPEAYDIGMGVGPGIIAGLGSRAANLDTFGQWAFAKSLPNFNPFRSWLKTKWYGGLDSKPRFEVPDAQSALRDIPQGDSHLYLPDVLKHDDLFEAYPHLKETVVHGQMLGAERGHYNPSSGNIAVRPDLHPAHYKSTLLHEIQHSVQDREGFERGANPTSVPMEFPDQYAAEIDRLTKSLQGPAETGWGVVNTMTPDQIPSFAAHNVYQRVGGEAEARAVQARMRLDSGMGPTVPPLGSYDIPLDQIILRGLSR